MIVQLKALSFEIRGRERVIDDALYNDDSGDSGGGRREIEE